GIPAHPKPSRQSVSCTYCGFSVYGLTPGGSISFQKILHAVLFNARWIANVSLWRELRAPKPVIAGFVLCLSRNLQRFALDRFYSCSPRTGRHPSARSLEALIGKLPH